MTEFYPKHLRETHSSTILKYRHAELLIVLSPLNEVSYYVKKMMIIIVPEVFHMFLYTNKFQ